MKIYNKDNCYKAEDIKTEAATASSGDRKTNKKRIILRVKDPRYLRPTIESLRKHLKSGKIMVLTTEEYNAMIATKKKAASNIPSTDKSKAPKESNPVEPLENDWENLPPIARSWLKTNDRCLNPDFT